MTLLDSCAVTNETTVLPGVVVHPEAVLGVYSLGRPGQVFPPGSITQVRGWMGGRGGRAGWPQPPPAPRLCIAVRRRPHPPWRVSTCSLAASGNPLTPPPPLRTAPSPPLTQGEVVLHPGRDIESGGKVDASGTKGVRNLKAVSGWVFARYNVLYWIATLTLLPMSCASGGACGRGGRAGRQGRAGWRGTFQGSRLKWRKGPPSMERDDPCCCCCCPLPDPDPPPPLLRLPVMVKDLPLAVVLISGLYFGGCWMSLALLPIGVIIALTSAILWMAFLKL